ncbi:MAG: hypothetical protein CR995_00195 [Clostridiales bacterium]|nr:MAG: hypothetical protein CR995_00195 [Clostridiales bacterium]
MKAKDLFDAIKRKINREIIVFGISGDEICSVEVNIDDIPRETVDVVTDMLMDKGYEFSIEDGFYGKDVLYVSYCENGF